MSDGARPISRDFSGRGEASVVCDEALLRAARALVSLSCGPLNGQRTVIAFDQGTDRATLASIHQACCASGEAILWDSGSFWTPPKHAAEDSRQRVPNCNLLIDLGSDYLLHAPALPELLKDGMRYACFPQLDSGFLRSHVGSEERYQRVLDESARWAAVLASGRYLRVASKANHVLECSLEGAKIDDAGRPARLPGEVTYLSGQVSFYPEAASIQGSLRIDGLMTPVGRLESAMTLEFREGVLGEIRGGWQAKALEEWVEEQTSSWCRHLAHLSLGAISGVGISTKPVLSERAYGAFVAGFGAQPPGLGIFPEVAAQATTHWDAITVGLEIRVDGRVYLPEETGIGDRTEAVA